MKIILQATKISGNETLNLIQRDTEHCQYVVCWNYSVKYNCWDWGTYCNSLKEALTAFTKKLSEHNFDNVFEG